MENKPLGCPRNDCKMEMDSGEGKGDRPFLDPLEGQETASRKCGRIIKKCGDREIWTGIDK